MGSNDLVGVYIKPGFKAYFSIMQLEKKEYSTPFTYSYRPAIQLPSTLDFAGNEVHETGTANFEDFSTVGITDGLGWILEFPKDLKDLKDFSGNNYTATNYGGTFDSESIYFNGSTYITLPYGDNINPSTNPQSFSMMIKKDSKYRYYILYYKSNWILMPECILDQALIMV